MKIEGLWNSKIIKKHLHPGINAGETHCVVPNYNGGGIEFQKLLALLNCILQIRPHRNNEIYPRGNDA